MKQQKLNWVNATALLFVFHHLVDPEHAFAHSALKIMRGRNKSVSFQVSSNLKRERKLKGEGHRLCTNQQPPQRGGAVSDPVWVGSKWLLAFPRVPVTPGTPLYFFAMLPPERPQKGSTQHLQNRSPVLTFSFLLPYSCSSSSPHSSSSPDER